MKQKQNTNYTVLAVGLVILLAVLAASCSTTRYNHESVNLKTGGELDKFHTRALLVKVRPTKLGWKHTFIADNGDTLRRYYDLRLDVDSCYFVRKTRLEK